MEDVVSAVRKIVKEAFSEMDMKFCGFRWYFSEHVQLVADIAGRLCGKYGGDREVIVLSAYLHDIGLIGKGTEGHEIRSAEKAGEVLAGLKYPAEKVERVRKAILATEQAPKTLEEKIVATADAMASLRSNKFLVKMFLMNDLGKFKKWMKAKAREYFDGIQFPEEKEAMRPAFELLVSLAAD